MRKLTLTIIAVLIASVCMLAGCAGTLLPVNESYDIPLEVNGENDGNSDFVLRVASYNLYGGEINDERMQKNIEYFNRENFDIAGFQEVDNGMVRSGNKDYLSMFKQGNYTDTYFVPSHIPPFEDKYGIGTLAQYELKSRHSYILPYIGEYISAEVEPRVLSRSVIFKDGIPFVFYNTHLSFEDAEADGAPLRSRQIEFIADIIKSDPNPYKILVGDFNIFNLDELKPFEKIGMRLAFTTGASHNEGLIDNIIYSDTLKINDKNGYSKIVTDLGTSDHNLLKVELIKNA